MDDLICRICGREFDELSGLKVHFGKMHLSPIMTRKGRKFSSRSPIIKMAFIESAPIEKREKEAITREYKRIENLWREWRKKIGCLNKTEPL